MTETVPAPSPEVGDENRTAPAVAYGLYLLVFVTGFTHVIGLILAYVKRGEAGPVAESHYTFLIYTFWLSLVWFIVGGLLFIVGVPLSLVIVGIPALAAGWAIMGLVGAWFAVRCVLGVLYLARGEAYPRPRNWLF